ncbi:MAG: Crp/Fnr family transcriptional regulator [Pseudomonadota bacterium]
MNRLTPKHTLSCTPASKPMSTRLRVPEALIGERPGATPHLEALFAEHGHERRLSAHESLFFEGDDAHAIYRVVSGLLRCYIVSEDGTRQIVRFAGPGASLGVSVVDFWHFSVEAVDPVVLSWVPRDLVDAERERDAELRHELRCQVARELRRRDWQLMQLAHLTSTERLMAFLVDFADSQRAAGLHAKRSIPLPMSRQDIGDFLGLSLETVSRAFSALKRAGRIEMTGSDRYRFPTTAPVQRSERGTDRAVDRAAFHDRPLEVGAA